MDETSIDMSMVPSDASFQSTLVDLVKKGEVPVSRIDESARRVIQLKKDLGLLKVPVPPLASALVGMVGQAADVEVSRDMARESLILLQNGASTPDMTIKAKEGQCIDASEKDKDGGLVHIWNCDPSNVNQQWIFDSSAGQVKSKEGKCLQGTSGNGVQMWTCDTTDVNQQWTYSNQELKLTTSNKCLGSSDSTTWGGLIELMPCDNTTADQQWLWTTTTVMLNPPNLPLSNTAATKIFVTGPTAHSLRSMSTGWSIHWQGAQTDSEFSHGTTILDGIKAHAPQGSTVTYDEGCAISASSHASATCDSTDLAATVTQASASDVVVVCLGEEPYTEKPGDIDDPILHKGQLELIRGLNAANIPMVLVLIAGRPRLLDGIQRLSNVIAVMHGFAPGPEGGMAVGEALFGVINPSGRMPLSYPATTSTMHYPHWHAVTNQCVGSMTFLSAQTGSCPIDFNFGQGLSYTTFEYTNMKWYTGGYFDTQASELKVESGAGKAFTYEMSVRNTGTVSANHTVLLYMIQDHRRVTPEANRLIGFDKVSLSPGETRNLVFELHTKNFSYVGVDMARVLETGLYTLALGDTEYGNPSKSAGVPMTITADCGGKSRCVLPIAGETQHASWNDQHDNYGRDATCGAGELLLPYWAVVLLMLCAVAVGAGAVKLGDATHERIAAQGHDTQPHVHLGQDETPRSDGSGIALQERDSTIKGLVPL